MASADVIVTSTSACAVDVFVFGSGQPIAGGALTSYDGEAVIDGDDYHTTNNENEKCTIGYCYWCRCRCRVSRERMEQCSRSLERSEPESARVRETTRDTWNGEWIEWRERDREPTRGK
jgi:hypothetical protein